MPKLNQYQLKQRIDLLKNVTGGYTWFSTFIADTGSTTANIKDDALTISGVDGIITSITGDSLDIDADINSTNLQFTANQINTIQNINVGASPTFVGLTLTGDLSVQGNTTLGDAITDDITFNGRMITSIIPKANDTYDLGTDALRWEDIYLGSGAIHIGTSVTDEGTIIYNTTGNILEFDTDSTTNGDIAFFTDDLYIDKSASAIGIGTTTPDPSSILDITSTTKGTLPPRMTEVQRDAIVSPISGLTIYNTDSQLVETYDGTQWSQGATGTSFLSTYDTTTQAVAVANTFQDVTWNTNQEIDGWTHSVVTNTEEFICNQTGTYKIFTAIQIQKAGGGNVFFETRIVKDNQGDSIFVEIPGSAHGYTLTTTARIKAVVGDNIIDVNQNDVIKVQITASATFGEMVAPTGSAATLSSGNIVVTRMK